MADLRTSKSGSGARRLWRFAVADFRTTVLDFFFFVAGMERLENRKLL
jgi:hypothetical protein